MHTRAVTLTTLVVVVAGVGALLPAAAGRAEPVYLGTATRGEIEPATAKAFKAALEAALSSQGVEVLDASAAAEEDADKAFRDAQQVLDDAAAAFSDGDYSAAFKGSAKAVEEFEKGPAFSDSGDAWNLFRDICALRALAALKLKKKQDAEDALRFLLVVQPKYAPNKARAPPELLQRIDDVKDELRSFPPAALELKSKPSGAIVIVDGKRRGKTPVIVEDLAPGVHYVSLETSSGRFRQRVTISEEGGSIEAKLGSRKGAAAKDVVRLLRGPVAQKKLLREVADVDDDAILAVLMPAGRKVEVIGARITDGSLRALIGIRTDDNDNDRERATYVLVEGLLERERDAWLDEAKGDDPKKLRERLFEGVSASVSELDSIDDEETSDEGLSPGVIAVGVIGGTLAAVAVATTVGVVLYRESRKDQGFTWTVDTTGLAEAEPPP